MFFRRSSSHRNSRKTITHTRRQPARLLRFEPLEQRRLLAAFDLGSYEKNSDIDLNLPLDDVPPESNLDDFSGAAYHTSESTEWIYVVDNNSSGTIVKYKKDGTFEKRITLSNFSDPEAITHVSGDVFAVIEEKDRDTGAPEEFHITIFTISPSTTSINKNSLNQNAPTDSPPTSGIIKLTHADLSDGSDHNKGPEGLAYDSNGTSDGYFYFAREKKDVDDNDLLIFRVPDKGGTVKAVNVDTLTFNEPNPRLLTDISDIYFVRTAAQPDGRLFVMSDESQKVLTVDMDADVDPEANQGLVGTIVTGAERSLPTDDYEGITFSPDGFEMTVVLDGGTRHMIQYRNFTAWTPNAAPVLVGDTNGITNDPTPTFSGTLTQSFSGGTKPVEGAYIWLYADNGTTNAPTGAAVVTDENGVWNVTAASLTNGTYDFTIRASETNVNDDDFFSLVSAKLQDVQIFYEDLTGNGFVDFQDLTILLANFNQNVSAAEGNLAEPATTPVNFEDLTALLAKWTGPGPDGQLMQQAQIQDEEQVPAGSPVFDSDTIYATSTEFWVKFDADVENVDSTDLELTGTGASGASVGTMTKHDNRTYSFHITGLSIGTVEVDLAPDSGDITYVTGGAWVGLKEWSFITLPGVTFTSGALVIEGTSGADTITVAVAGGDLTLNGAKVNLGSGDIAASAVTSILIQGYAGD
ncbi:MAG: SdiA-regulated domain-containing protein, partial [Planctomycetes bacterium]|nr:SdiA-regulated domain-containing protein [Planctomycetota bacterium]